ncbi:MAG: T9SS type A sorting domain-containing protein, partial [Bacteroidales bacterium]|nr:T9SS type A sorting domain-containing protein [Bacteroidales bacterium]
MKKAITIFFYLSSTLCYAQLSWDWAFDLNHSDNDYIENFALDQNGNIYAIVNFYGGDLLVGNDTMVPPLSGFRPSFLMKLNDNGEYQWGNQITTSNQIYLKDVCTDSDNNVYVGGTYIGEINISGIELPSTSSGMFIAKYDNLGNVIDVYNYTNIGSASIISMCINDANEIFITGNYLNDFTIDDNELVYNNENPGRSDTYIAKIGVNKNILWIKSISGTGDDISTKIACDQNGNIYLLGRFSSNVLPIEDFTLYSNVSDLSIYDIFIIRYDNEGHVIWAEKLGDEEDDYGHEISIDIENNIYIAGKFSGNIFVINDTILQGGCPCQNSFLVKIDSTYNTIWGFSFGNQGNNYARSITTNHIGESFLLGNFSDYLNINGFYSSYYGASDIYIAHLNPEGGIIGLNCIGGENFDISSKIAIDSNGNCIIGGCFRSSSINFGDDILYNDIADNSDIFIAKLSHNTNLELNVNNLEFSIFPNPTSTSFTIKPKTFPANVQIFDLNGKLLNSINDYSGEKIDITDFQSGIYFVKL